MVSEGIREALLTVPPSRRWMHAYTYSGHPTCCAVGLKNLEILEREGLVEQAARKGRYLRKRLEALRELDGVGEVRGLGMMAAVELAEDREARRPYDPGRRIGERVKREAAVRGLFTRFIRDVILLAPPFVITEAEIDRLVEILRESIRAVLVE